MKRSRRGILFILSAPSGAGKTTLSRAALQRIEGLEASVSLTTRKPREGESDGVDYRFVSPADFERVRREGGLAEWAEVFDAHYGTPREPLERAIATGRDLLLDIDIQGARQIWRRYPQDAVSVFVMPPSFADLEQRLRRRATEDEKAIRERLQRAWQEASAFPEYNYLIINVDRERSLGELACVVEAERLRVGRLRPEFVPWKR